MILNEDYDFTNCEEDMRLLENDYLSNCQDLDTEIEHDKISTKLAPKKNSRGKVSFISIQNSLFMKYNTMKKKLREAVVKFKSCELKLSRLQKRYEKFEQNNVTSVDDFLDSRKCVEPIRRTMIKLQLHKDFTHYSDEESNLARLIFYHSHACYSRLRAAG